MASTINENKSNIIISDNIDFVYSLKPLNKGEGSFGKCYFYDGDNVLKFYFQANDGEPFLYKYFKHRNATFSTKDLKPISGIENETYYFPHTLFMNDCFVTASVSKFCPGYNLGLLNGKVKITDYINATPKFYKDTSEISKEKILTKDLTCNNMLFKDKHFFAIDTDLYEKREDKSESECETLNLERLQNKLIRYFLFIAGSDNDTNGKVSELLAQNYELFDLYYSLSINATITNKSSRKISYDLLCDFFEKYTAAVESKCNTRVRTIKELQQAVMAKK